MDGTADRLPEHYDRVGMAAALVDSGLCIIQANHTLAGLLGASPDALQGQPLAERLAGAANAATKSYDKSIFRFLRAEGELWFRLDLHPEGDKTLAILVDITLEQLQIEHLRFTSTVNDQLMEEAKIGIWRYDPDVQIYYFASALSLGYENTGSSVPLDQLCLIQHPADKAMDADRRERITTEGGRVESEIRYRHAQGHWVHFRVHYISGRRLLSGLYEMYGITQNITPQAAARDAAKTYGHRLKLALKAANGAVFEYSYRKKSYWASDELSAILGVENAAPLLLNGGFKLFAEEDRESLYLFTRRVRSGEETDWIDVRLLTTHGPRWTRIYVEVERYPDGQPNRAVGLILDVDDQKKQEIALDEARLAAESAVRAKSNFLATMSHEIRTPLNGVLGMAQALQNEPLTADQFEQVETILDSGKMLMALLNDVLDLSKIEAGKLEIANTRGDLRHAIERTIGLFRQNAGDKGVGLSVQLDPSLPGELAFDPVRVRQCLSNLLSNAIKFTQSGGQVGLRLESRVAPDNQYRITIAISDTGIGMDRETLGKLFSAFTQADASTSRSFGGTGLGLAISRQLARLMGGEIAVASEPGRGSVFTLTFMAQAAVGHQAANHVDKAEPATPPATTAGTTPAKASSRLLLVDDNAINRRVIRLFLAPHPIEIREAENGKEALALLRQETFDIVLLDVHMPIMDGTETIHAIRASAEPWRDIAVIALTADGMSGDRERYLSMGMTDYLSKPVDLRELVSKVTALLPARGAAPADSSVKRAEGLGPPYSHADLLARLNRTVSG